MLSQLCRVLCDFLYRLILPRWETIEKSLEVQGECEIEESEASRVVEGCFNALPLAVYAARMWPSCMDNRAASRALTASYSRLDVPHPIGRPPAATSEELRKTSQVTNATTRSMRCGRAASNATGPGHCWRCVLPRVPSASLHPSLPAFPALGRPPWRSWRPPNLLGTSRLLAPPGKFYLAMALSHVLAFTQDGSWVLKAPEYFRRPMA